MAREYGGRSRGGHGRGAGGGSIIGHGKLILEQSGNQGQLTASHVGSLQGHLQIHTTVIIYEAGAWFKMSSVEEVNM